MHCWLAIHNVYDSQLGRCAKLCALIAKLEIAVWLCPRRYIEKNRAHCTTRLARSARHLLPVAMVFAKLIVENKLPTVLGLGSRDCCR